MSGSTFQEALARIIQDLKSPLRSLEQRQRSGLDLRGHVQMVSRELTGDSFTRFMNDINRRIFELIHSPEVQDKIGGILAIEYLVDFDGEENATKITRFANYLRSVLPGTDAQLCLLASRALGKLAAAGGALTVDFVEFEVKRSLEWLQDDRVELKRFAAVCVLKELMQNAPTILYTNVAQILELLWIPLRDMKPAVREQASAALGACLDIVYQRETNTRLQWYRRIIDEISRTLRSAGNPLEAVHGSLLALDVMLLHTGRFMDDYFVETADLVLKLRDHKDVNVRKAVMSVIPLLAEYNPNEFITNYLHLSMTHLLSQVKREKDKSSTFIAIGKLALHVGSSIGPYLDAVVNSLRDELSSKYFRSRPGPEHNALFKCISMLAKSVGQALTKHIHELLDQIFSVRFSEMVLQALVDISNYIPPLLPVIQIRLLNQVSQSLTGNPFRMPGQFDGISSLQILAAFRELQVSENKDVDYYVLNLNTLGSFDFTGYNLNEFVRDFVVGYLDDDIPEIRKSAALTCCNILVKDPQNFFATSRTSAIVAEVLSKLLSVAIADPESDLRRAVLQAMDPRFDRYLSQPENIRSLFISLNDESFENREIAISIIGRLTVFNPAYILPALRKTLIQLMTDLEYSVASRSKEESAILLGKLICASQRLIKPYVEPILKVLYGKLNDTSLGVSSQVLSAIGELAEVGREELIPYLPKLMPLLIETLQEQSSSTKREATLKTLGQLTANTSFTVEAFIEYPELLAIIINLIKSENVPVIRKEVMKVVGILGALDPYRHKLLMRELELPTSPTDNATEDVDLSNSPSQNEDFFNAVAMNALVAILKDASLAAHHTASIQAIMYIFKTLGLKCVPFLPKVMPTFFSVMKGGSAGLLEFHFQHLANLVAIVKDHIRPYVREIFDLIKEYWNPESLILNTIMSLVESIARALDTDFKIYISFLLPQLLLILESDITEKRLPTEKTLELLVVFGGSLEGYLQLILPALLKMIEKPDMAPHIRRFAVQTVGKLAKRLSFHEYASRIIHPLARVLKSNVSMDLKQAIMEALCALVFQLRNEFMVFIPMIHKICITNKIQNHIYSILITKLLNGESLPQEVDGIVLASIDADENTPSVVDSNTVKKLPVNQQHLKNSWETAQRSTKEDWAEWHRRLSVEFLKESPAHSLRACASLANVYFPLARELFNAAFLSCWGELYDQFQDELVKSLEVALTSPTIPPETLQTLLNLSEFMEHDDKPLPIDIKTLGIYAAKCHAYAKALHYTELEFQQNQSPEIIEQLISINNQLQQPDAAIGILTYAQEHHSVELKESWYEKLQRWEDALFAYDKKQSEDPVNMDVTLGRMRCLQALGDWEQLSQLAQEKWFTNDKKIRKMIAPLGAAAAWGLGQWELMDDYISSMDSDIPDSMFFRSILAIHRNQFGIAEQFIDKTRSLLDVDMKALIGESYNRAYTVVVKTQMLTELEEIISYKKYHDMPERQHVIKNTWAKRLKGCQQNVEVWQNILKVRSLVVPPKDDMLTWIKFANLCRKSGRTGLSNKILGNLLQADPSSFENLRTGPPAVVYAYLKHTWVTTSSKAQTLQTLTDYARSLSQTIHNQSTSTTFNENTWERDKKTENMKILARCHVKIGAWLTVVDDHSTEDAFSPILQNYFEATKHDKNWYKAWHSWALANFEVISLFEKSADSQLPHSKILQYAVPAVKAFFKSISLSAGNALQDTLRLLTILFKYGYHAELFSVISEGFATVSIDTWLDVIPQLIARIHTPNPQVRRLIHQILAEVGKEHPQALVYSLTVASKSQSVPRRNSALSIMDKMRMHSSLLIEQALLVSQELIRVAILWHEMWHEGLEEASRLYFGDHNVAGMFAVLEPLHQMLRQGPDTLREISFIQAFGRDLQEAYEWGRKYQVTGVENDLHQAWDLYYQVFRKINKQLPQLTTVELQYVSPKLLAAHDLELAIPGSYKSGEDVVKISSFVPTLNVITSKQRPRKLVIKGSDGRD